LRLITVRSLLRSWARWCDPATGRRFQKLEPLAIDFHTAASSLSPALLGTVGRRVLGLTRVLRDEAVDDGW
jgi:hypothetical protein